MLRTLALFRPGTNRHTVFQLREDAANYDKARDHNVIVGKILEMGFTELLALGQDSQLLAFCRTSNDPKLLRFWEDNLVAILGDGPENELKPMRGFTRFDQLLGLLSYQHATENLEEMSHAKRFELLLRAVQHGHYHAGVALRQLLEAGQLSTVEQQKLKLSASAFLKLLAPGCILISECMQLMKEPKQAVFYFYVASMLTDKSQNAFHNALLSSSPEEWAAQMMLPATNALFEHHPEFSPADITDHAQTEFDLSSDECQRLRAQAEVAVTALKTQLSIAELPNATNQQHVMPAATLVGA